MYIDTHTHLSDEEGVTPDSYIQNALEQRVSYLIPSFCEKNSIKKVSDFMSRYSNVYGAVGYHPDEVNNIVQKDLDELEFLLKTEKKIVAIGEIGLDYYWHKDNKEQQIALFRYQLELAIKYQKPVVIHSRDSIGEVYQILKEYPVVGVIHCFSGSLEMAKQFIQLGYVLGIGGVVTFKNSKLKQVVEQVPLSSIVLETDSPYLTPEPYRGQVNQSSYIPIIAKKIADIQKISASKVEKETTLNAIRVFDLDIDL